MPNITLALDDETHAIMRRHPAVNWSEVAREAVRRKARELHVWDALLVDSKLTEAQAAKAGRDSKQAILRRLGW